ncbi:MAG: HAD family hydrolase [Streptosporangiaceae bacterium]
MTERAVTHVLLDFFGTLVSYSPSQTEQGYARSHALAWSWGAQTDYCEFLQAWAAEWGRFDDRSAIDLSEFSMTEISAAVLTRMLGGYPSAARSAALASAYLREWNTGVSYPPGTVELVAGLASQYRLAVVTNTHQADLVPAHLAAMGIARYIDAVITSVEVGWRKPHPAIYAAALRRLGVGPADAAFVGDTYEAEYGGPVAAGMTAFLIDPGRRHDIPAQHRLTSLADLPARLRLHAVGGRNFNPTAPGPEPAGEAARS